MLQINEKNLISLASSVTQDDNNSIYEENNRFSKHHPLLNIIILSVGPFLTQFGMSFIDSVDLMLISKRFHNEPQSYAVQIIGIGFFVQQIIIYIGLFFQQSLIVRVSSLIGEGRRITANRLVVDVFRISFIFNIFACVIITFISRPMMIFAGCTPELIERCNLLIISTIAGLPFTTIFHVTTGFLQSIGKAILNGLVHLAANCLQTFIVTPILQFLLQIDVTLSNISQPICQSIIGIVLFFLIFKGNFSLKPTFEMFFQPFQKEICKAFILSLPMIPVWLYGILPTSFILRAMTSSSSSSETFKTDVIAVYTILQKLFFIALTIPMAISTGFLTTASHSISQKNYKRMFVSFYYSLLIILLSFVVLIPWVCCQPDFFMKLFGVNSDSQLKIAKKMVPIPMDTFPIGISCVFMVSFFIVVGKTWFSIVIPAFQLASISAGSWIMKTVFHNDPIKQMFSYTISDVSTTILTLILFVVTCIQLAKKNNDANLLFK